MRVVWITEGFREHRECESLPAINKCNSHLHETGRKCIYIFDNDTVQYDLATTIGAYNYATFVSLLATKHVPELVLRLKKRWAGESELSGKNWGTTEWIRNDWTMAEQIAWFEERGYLDYFDCYSV